MTRTSIIEQARIKAEVVRDGKIKKGLERLHSSIAAVFTPEDASAATYYTWTGPLIAFAELDGVILSLINGQDLQVLTSGESIPAGRWSVIKHSGDLHHWADSAVVAAQIIARTGWKPQVTPA